MGTPYCRGRGDDRILLATGVPVEEIATEAIVQLGGRNRTIEARTAEELPDVRVGFHQHARRKQHVVDPDDPLLVQLHIVHERRPAAEREVQCVVQVVIEIGTGADQKIDQPALHQLDNTAAESCGRQSPGDGEPDHGVVLGPEHLVSVDAAGLRQAGRIERLEPIVQQPGDVGAAFRAIVGDGPARQMVGARMTWRSRGAMGHGP